MANSLRWLWTFHWGKLLTDEHFLIGLFPPGTRKTEQIQKRDGMDQAGVWLTSLHCYSLATAWERQPGAYIQPHTVHSTAVVSTTGQRCRKPLGCAGGFQSQPKWNAGHGALWVAASLPRMGAYPGSASWDWVLALHLPVAGVEAWKISFRLMGLGPLYLDSLCWTFLFSLF